MEEAHWKGTEKIRRFLFMGFFSLLILSIGFFIGMGDSLAGAKKRDKAALSSVSGGLAGKRRFMSSSLTGTFPILPFIRIISMMPMFILPIGGGRFWERLSISMGEVSFPEQKTLPEKIPIFLPGSGQAFR